MTQRKIILSLLADEPTRKFFSYELAKASTKYGWLGLSGDRRARELAEDGLVNREEKEGYAVYFYKPKETLF
jgi:uncharacterized protein (DUF488 family)